MTEDNEAWVSAHALIEKKTGLTIGDLRALLASADKVGLPDTTELRVRPSWRLNKYGARVIRITAASKR